MIRSIFLACIALLQTVAGFTAEISKEKARQVATNFVLERTNLEKPVDRSELIITDEFIKKEGNETLWYIFNFQPRSYCIVSADDAVVPVLAYSLDGTYSTSEPSQFTAWMKQYSDQILHARQNNIPPSESTTQLWKNYLVPPPSSFVPRTTSFVPPLITSNWNQNAPYNAACPADPAGPGGHAYAGCVPTCMGQVMYYFRWPETGTGNYSYYDSTYGTLSANFDTTYDWNDMTDVITNSNSSIPLLLYHLGVSCDLVYGPDGSGMYNHKAAYSLRTFFKYSPHTQYVFRDSTSMDWDSILISHLDRKIPMYYAGWSLPNVNGHAFVCDGYQDSCYFHFNFGWSGQNNGYFYTSDLIVGGNNFNLAQEVIINCVPDSVNYTYPVYCSGEHNFKQRQGSFEDGSGPLHNYPSSASCSWIIDPQDDTDSISSIKLSFERFDMDEASSVDIYKGTTTADPLIGSFTGSTVPADIVSDHNQMLVVYTSGPSSSAPGFYATYSTTSPVWCSGTTTITADTAEFSDGSFGFNYHNGQSCKWKLISASGGPLTLNFRRFDTEPVNDNLKIYDLTTQALLAEYSGHCDSLNPPAPVTVESGQAFLIFSTNSSVTGKGWEIYYPKSNLGMERNELFPDLQIYPNPAKDDFTVRFTSTEPQQVSVLITDARGRNVMTFQQQATAGNNHWKLATGNFPPGVFTVSVSTSQGKTIKKLVIY